MHKNTESCVSPPLGFHAFMLNWDTGKCSTEAQGNKSCDGNFHGTENNKKRGKKALNLSRLQLFIIHLSNKSEARTTLGVVVV